MTTAWSSWYNVAENDVTRATRKIEQVKAVFRSAYQALTEFEFTASQSNLLGDNNIVRLTQKVNLLLLAVHTALKKIKFQSIDHRDRIVELVDSKMLLTPPAGYEDYQQRPQQPRDYSNARPPRQDNHYRQRQNKNGYDSYQSRSYQSNPSSYHRSAGPRVSPQGQVQRRGSSSHGRPESGRGDRSSNDSSFKRRRY